MPGPPFMTFAVFACIASERASGIITVSGATERDVTNLVPQAASRIRLIYNAPDPLFLQRRLPEALVTRSFVPGSGVGRSPKPMR